MANSKNRQQRETEDYLSRIKLRELFQGLLHQVIIEQPEKPFEYFHKEIGKIKNEMEESNIDIGSTTFLTAQYPPTELSKHIQMKQNTNRTSDH